MSGDDTEPDAPKSLFTPEARLEFRRGMFFGHPSAGYKRPPEHSRFKPGQSGNPRGRPKSDRGSSILSKDSVGSAVLALARRKMVVRERGEDRTVSVLEAILLAQQKSALLGNAIAQKNSLDRLEKLEREESSAIEDQHEYAEAYIKRARERIAAAKATGEPVPELYPHPDDIVLEPGVPVRFIGPLTSEQAEQYKNYVALRTALLWQAGMEYRCNMETENASSVDRLPSALVLAQQINDVLPPRMRLNDVQLQMIFERASLTGKRILLRQVRQLWCEAGVRARRGARLQDLAVIIDMQEFAINQIKHIFSTDNSRG